MIAPGQQPQALRGLVEQIGLGQDAAADRDHGVGGEDEGAAQFVVELHGFERRLGLGARQPIGAGARQLAPLRGLVDIGRAQRVGLDAGLVEQAEPSRRTGSENEFGTANHAGFVRDFGIGRGVRAEPIGRHSIPQPGNKWLLKLHYLGRPCESRTHNHRPLSMGHDSRRSALPDSRTAAAYGFLRSQERRECYPLAAPTLENRRRMRIIRPSQTSR